MSVDRKRGQRKGATSKNVKSRQKMSEIFSTFIDNFRAAPVFWPLLGGSESYDVFCFFWTFRVEIVQGMSKICVNTGKEEGRKTTGKPEPAPPLPGKSHQAKFSGGHRLDEYSGSHLSLLHKGEQFQDTTTMLEGAFLLQTVPEGHKHRVTTPEKPRKMPRTPAEPRRDPAEPSERPRRAL